MNSNELMIETTTVGGDVTTVTYREARRVARSLERCNARTRQLRAAWCAANGVAEDADPFAAFAA